ncbi:hypothetical protein BJ684DRAFT_19371 [Piptocephalis cylindrospora]|uniref:Uncharacterized protein n=1 Tax=Piptocephalis cylindrospora TaxID=1907219 RepID=A0A4P9Y5F7_9FUNG|nr:hypothetical protein BJ684DRAFT_19371 [Piptocephalis cylindrospora]|eukprot:RKP14207.1 hypothetical protein BJ684DRAFT_19371 [Piptocephalis cylindrospora]
MACVTVWSADLGASQTIIIHDYGHIHHHEGFTFGALAIIIVCMIVSFTVMAAAYPKPTLHRTILMGLLAGACIPVQHYISQLYMRNMSYRCTWWSIVLCTLTSIITFTGFFHLVSSCVFLLIIALLGRRSQVQSRAKNNVNSLALARFDFTGRILLTPKGTLPCQVIQDPNHPEDPWRQTIQRDDLEFRWLWRASRFWTEISQHTGHLFTAWETEDAELEAKMKKRINFSLPWKKPHATDPESSETEPSSVVRLCPAHRFQRNTPSSDIEFHRQGRVLVLCSTIQEHAEIIALTFLGYEFHDPISIASRLSVEMSARKSEMLSGLDHWYSLALSTQQNGLASPTSYSHPQRVANTLRTMESGGRSRRGSITIEPQSAEKIGVLAWILRAGSQNSLDILAPSREPHSLPSISVPGCTLQELHNLWCGYDGGWGNAPLSLFLPCLETGGDACRQGLRAAVNQLIRKMQPLPLEQARLYAYIVEWTRGYPCVALYLFLKTEDTQPGRWRHPWLQRRGRSAPTVHSRITPKDHTWVPWHLWRVMHHTLLHNREIDEKMWSLAVRREYGPLRLILNKSFNWGEDEVSVFLRMEQFIQDQLQAEVTDESRVEDILVNIQLIEEGVVPGEWWEHPIPDTRMYTTGRPEGESQEDQEEDDHIPMEHSTSGYSSPSPPPLRGDQLSNMPSTAKIVDRIGYGDWWMGLMKESLTLG